MSAAFLGKDIVAETKDILLKGVHKLDGCLYLYPIHAAFKINRLMNRCFPGI